MAGIEPVGRGAQPRRRGGDVEPSAPEPAGHGDPPPRFSGGTIDYGDWQYSPGDAWKFLSPLMRAWAEEHAGDPIRDPHSGAPTVYWNCWVRLGPQGPRGTAPTATYGLVMFGKRGLVTSTGTTDHFVDATGATRWRNRRFAVPLDPDGVRHDHRTEAAPVPVTPAPSSSPAGGGPQPADRPPDDLLPDDVARMYGHLPAATQSFQCDPFADRGAAPAESDVFATIEEDDRERRETYWAYMFDARWVTFAHARRAVPVRGGRRGRGRRRGVARQGGRRLPSAEGLDTADWKVAAWAAPVLRPGRGLETR